jgi:hypothetical protein
VALHDNVVYVTLPRKLYSMLSAITGWNIHYDLNPLVKLTHYIDELIVVVKLLRELEKTRVALVFGSMSLFSFFSRILGARRTLIIHGPQRIMHRHYTWCQEKTTENTKLKPYQEEGDKYLT